jgi:hypothetical protein
MKFSKFEGEVIFNLVPTFDIFSDKLLLGVLYPLWATLIIAVKEQSYANSENSLYEGLAFYVGLYIKILLFNRVTRSN